MADAGWYPDVSNEGWQAYWDGQRWTGDRRPGGQAGAQADGRSGAQGVAQGTPGVGPWGPASGHDPALGTAHDPAAPVDQTQRIDRAALPPQAAGGAPQSPGAAPQGGGWEQPPEWGQPGQQGHYGQQSPYGQQGPYGEQGPYGQQSQQGPYGAGPGDWQQHAGPQDQHGQQNQPPGWPQQPRWDEPQQPPARGRNRKPILIAAAAVVVLAAGLITFLAWPDDAPALTYDGKQIADAGTTLSRAEATVKASVKSRHGTSSNNTRCYFAQAKKPAKGQKSSDIEQTARCGPVLFVDGNISREYLSVPLSSKSAPGGRVTLTASTSVGGLQPQAVSDDLKLNRPDGRTAPSGNGGLSVPKPPAASSTELAIADLGPTTEPKSLGSGAVMVGRDTRVALTAAGYIDRYGAGDAARSAPSGMKLVAFQVDYGAGDVSGTSSARAQLLVSGQAARTLPDADSGDWIVAAVPTTGASLQLTDGGYKQTLSLPDGKPGSSNIAVLRRTHRTSLVFKSFSVPIRLTRNDGATANVTLKGRTSFASLDFWSTQNSSVHASSPQNALLSVNPYYTVSGSSKTYGFDPTLIKLRVSGGRQVTARNIASNGKIYNVFEVPASFTTGVLTVSGSEKVGDIKLSVRKSYSFTVSIQAG